MDLDRIAVALALTRFMLNLPYSSWMTPDFDFPNDVAKRDPSLEKKSLAVKPHDPKTPQQPRHIPNPNQHTCPCWL